MSIQSKTPRAEQKAQWRLLFVPWYHGPSNEPLTFVGFWPHSKLCRFLFSLINCVFPCIPLWEVLLIVTIAFEKQDAYQWVFEFFNQEYIEEHVFFFDNSSKTFPIWLGPFAAKGGFPISNRGWTRPQPGDLSGLIKILWRLPRFNSIDSVHIDGCLSLSSIDSVHIIKRTGENLIAFALSSNGRVLFYWKAGLRSHFKVWPHQGFPELNFSWNRVGLFCSMFSLKGTPIRAIKLAAFFSKFVASSRKFSMKDTVKKYGLWEIELYDICVVRPWKTGENLIVFALPSNDRVWFYGNWGHQMVNFFETSFGFLHGCLGHLHRVPEISVLDIRYIK